jgi:hypothetical protein
VHGSLSVTVRAVGSGHCSVGRKGGRLLCFDTLSQHFGLAGYPKQELGSALFMQDLRYERVFSTCPGLRGGIGRWPFAAAAPECHQLLGGQSEMFTSLLPAQDCVGASVIGRLQQQQ